MLDFEGYATHLDKLPQNGLTPVSRNPPCASVNRPAGFFYLGGTPGTRCHERGLPVEPTLGYIPNPVKVDF